MHKHLVVTALAENPTNSPEVVIEFLNRLVNLVDMETFMEARAKYCGDPKNSGVTGDVVITTSHASIHIWDNVPGNPYPGLVQMDLYSCKDFNAHDVLNFIEEYFGAEIVKYQVIDRGLSNYFKGLPSSAASAASLSSPPSPPSTPSNPVEVKWEKKCTCNYTVCTCS